MKPRRFDFLILWSLVATGFFLGAPAQSSYSQDLPIPIANVQRTEPIDFGRDIYPIIKQNCVACHHAKEAEGGLNLETHELMVKGGDAGPAVKPKDVAASLLMTRATGEEEIMPPDDNEVGAKRLTPEQLGLIKLWIEQGAQPSEIKDEPPIDWQPIPETFRTIYSLDVSPDGRYVACGRGNRVFVYDVASGTQVGQLIDPAIESTSGPGAADVDMVQSIAFSPDASLIATGGYRSVRLWKQNPKQISPAIANASGIVALNGSREQYAVVNAIGDIEVRRAADGMVAHTLNSHSENVTGLAWARSADRLISADSGGRLNVWQPSTGQLLGSLDVSISPKEIVVSGSGDRLAVLSASRQVLLFDVIAAADGKVTFAAKPLPSLEAIKDANALVLVDQPVPAVIVATESVGAKLIQCDNGTQLRAFNHGTAIASLTMSDDQQRLVTGGKNGIIKVWNFADAKQLFEIKGDVFSKLQLDTARRDSRRQKAKIGRLEAKTKTLETALTKEDEAVKKVQEAKDQAQAKVAEEQKKASDASAKVTATQSAIDQATMEKAKAVAIVADAQKLLASQQAAKKQLTEQLTAAKAERDKAAATLAEAEKKFQALMKQVASADQQIAAKNQEIQTATKAQTDLTAKATALTKQLENEKKAADTANGNKVKADEDLKKREQALAAAKQAQERAKAAVPAHLELVAGEKRRNDRLAARLAGLETSQTDALHAVGSVAISPDGKTLASLHASGEIRTHDLASGRPRQTYLRTSNDHSNGKLTFLSDQSVGCFHRKASASVLSLENEWTLVRKIGSPEKKTISDRVTALKFRRDGATIAVGSGPPSRFGDVKIFSVSDGALVRDFGEVHSDSVLGLSFSPDGNVLASSAADKTVRLLELQQGSVIRSLEGHTHHVLAVAWQDDAQTLASASADQNVKVWNVDTGGQRRTIAGFGKEINAIRFLKESSQVLTACADGQVRLHETTNGGNVRTFNAAGDFLYALAVTQDGTRVIAGGQNGSLRIWDVSNAKQLHEIK